MDQLNENNFRYGIEYEFALVNKQREFVDFSNTTFEDLDLLIDQLPTYESDYPGLRVGDLKIKAKRWYIEGFERFSDDGKYLRTDIKGLEIRTPISRSINEAVNHLETDLALFDTVAKPLGYRSIGTGLNPFRAEFKPSPPLNAWEVAHRSTPEEQTAYIHMLTYGPDVSISNTSFSTEQVIDAARKLTYYSPFIVPFSFSSPFYEGKLWGGLSRRTYYRTGERPAALAFINGKGHLIKSKPSLTEEARLPAEVGRIEFKAFDSSPSIKLYGSLLALVKGIILDTSLLGRSTTPDKAQHQLSARRGFEDDTIYQQAKSVFEAARSALPESDQNWLLPLEEMLTTKRIPADTMIEQYRVDPDIITLLETNNAATL